MPTNTLFDSEKQKSKFPFVIISVFIFLLAIAGGVYGYWKYLDNAKNKAEAEAFADAKLRDSIVLLIAQPKFSGPNFSEQILGAAKLQKLNIRKREVYFSYPAATEEEFITSTDNFIIDRQKMENAVEIDGDFTLGDYSLTKTAENGYFFKTPLENLKFKTPEDLKFQYQNATYTMSVPEMIDLMDNKRIYGGRLNAVTNKKYEGITMMFANHGAFVAKPEEPTLQRFVGEILRDVPADGSREVKIQKLLDFVTNEIEYDFVEAVSNYETLKRPNEVLMTRKSDCSNKTILMASMLEQIGEDYLMLYSPRHITIAVPQGAFPTENKLVFEWEGKKWVTAETTLPNFIIGVTKVQESVSLTTVEYVQKPRQTGVIFDVDTFRPLEFQ
jgi:hypothetical protein